MAKIGGRRFAKHFFKHSAKIIRIFIAELLADFRDVQGSISHDVDRFVHSQLRMGFDDALSGLFLERGR